MKKQRRIEHALLRGRYMKAAALIEHYGIPIDTVALKKLRENWESIQDSLIARIDADFGVFDGRTFKTDRFAQYLSSKGMSWPLLPSGKLALDDSTFKDMVKVYPELISIRELRTSLSQMRLSDLSVGSDGRNRCLLSAFRSRTGRNQPSNARFIFGTAVWLRGLIKPPPGFGLAYIDWSQQEFGIAAALSGDVKMIEAHASGDPYLAFAKQAKAIPPNGTKHTHGAIRDQYKACVLAVQYGMGPVSLAGRIGKSVAEARELLRIHKSTYPKFWKWSDAAVDHAMLKGYLTTTFGWMIQTGTQANDRSLRNFPMQANGSEMLRLACCFATERGIRVCAPVHDAILIEAPLKEIDSVVSQTQEAMAEASGIILDGFKLRSDAKLICYPNRYEDERGKQMWEEVFQLINQEEKEPVHRQESQPTANEQAHVHSRTTDSSYHFLLGGS
jgi:DNA polymerase-1